MLAAISVVCLLITFANTLDPDQDPRYVGPDLDPNRLALFDTACLIRFIDIFALSQIVVCMVQLCNWFRHDGNY